MEIFYQIIIFFISIIQLVKSSSISNLDMFLINKTPLLPNLTYVTFSPTHLFTLDQDNLVQILDKSNPAISYFNLTKYVPISNQVDNVSISALVFNESYQTLVLVGSNNTKLTYYFYNIVSNTVPEFNYSYEFSNLTLGNPNQTFMVNSKVCSFYNNLASQKDILYCFYTNNSTNIAINLTTTAASLSITPNLQKAVFWDINSQIIVYQIRNSIAQLYSYSGSYTSHESTTQAITFSSDSQIALIETDAWNPVKLLNLSQYGATITNITVNSEIKSIDFIETSNRYILINCPMATYIYDRTISYLYTISSVTVVADSILVDINISYIITEVDNARVWQQITLNIPGSVMPIQMSYQLNLSQWQNQTFEKINATSEIIIDIMSKISVIIFSSPFTCFFLGFLNYFTLNSLYVLLNMPLPSIIFDQLSVLYFSVNQNLLSFLNIDVSVDPISDELVDGQKALYFGISSDLFSSNYYAFGLILANIVVFQAILAAKKIIPKRSKMQRFLEFQRKEIYFGLIVSLMVGIYLPWNFAKNEFVHNFNTKNNLIAYHFLCYFLACSLWFNLIYILKANHKGKEIKPKKDEEKQKKLINEQIQIKKQSKRNKKIQDEHLQDLPQCVIGFQNLIYPLFVMLQRPIYFLVIVLISKIIQIKTFVKHSKEKGLTLFLQMGSFICELVYHLTFFVLLYAQNQEVIIYNCMVCLGFFYLGAIFNLIIIFVFFAQVFKKIILSIKKDNKVNDLKEGMHQLGPIQGGQSPQLQPKPIQNQKPLVIFEINDEELSRDANNRQSFNAMKSPQLQTLQIKFKPVKKEEKMPAKVRISRL